MREEACLRMAKGDGLFQPLAKETTVVILARHGWMAAPRRGDLRHHDRFRGRLTYEIIHLGCTEAK